MIHKKLEFSVGCEGRLNYVYRGDNHEHEVVMVRHLGGNIFSGDPFTRDRETGLVTGVDVSQIQAEMEAQASMHAGKGEKLYGHYVLSLASGESLTESQWLHAVTEYMEAMGYDSSTKWTAAIHDDSGNQHVHLVTCRVKNKPNYPLVNDSNDYEKGFTTIRELEDRFGLQRVESPDQNWGKEYTKCEIKAGADRSASDEDVDDAVIIRRRFNDIWKNKPATMPDLIDALKQRGIETNIRTNKQGDPTGINYRVRGRKAWISGSKVKSTRTTWGKLISKEGINYKPWRDNPALGLPVREKPESTGPESFYAFIKLTQYQHKRLKLSGKKHNVYQVPRKGLVVRLDFNFLMSPHQRKAKALARQMQLTTQAVIEALRMILEGLFGKAQVIGLHENDWAIPKDWQPQYEFENGHAFGVSETIVADGLSTEQFLNEETSWRKRVYADDPNRDPLAAPGQKTHRRKKANQKRAAKP
ncbi:MAG: relaxase/mobilization nuclease domain-containing protein [Oceanospirillales bacterium]|nr:relaxase/mobilization nuclease domain-containing protein [Oceanospirillales bacterium]